MTTTTALAERAGWVYAGRECRRCGGEIVDIDRIVVDEDRAYDDDGVVIDRTKVEHVSCEPED